MIDHYQFGRIVIDGQSYESDVIIYPCWCVDDTWWRDQGHLLQLVDLEDALAAEPDVLVVGTGAYGRMKVAEEVHERLRQLGIDLIAARTAQAVEHVNELVESRRVVAALHLTC